MIWMCPPHQKCLSPYSHAHVHRRTRTKILHCTGNSCSAKLVFHFINIFWRGNDCVDILSRIRIRAHTRTHTHLNDYKDKLTIHLIRMVYLLLLFPLLLLLKLLMLRIIRRSLKILYVIVWVLSGYLARKIEEVLLVLDDELCTIGECVVVCGYVYRYPFSIG